MGEIRYISTRGDAEKITGAEAIIRGLAPDRGLYVPTEFPEINIAADFDAAQLANAGYKGIAKLVLAAFLPDFSESEIDACINGAYDEKFDTPDIAPLRRVERPGAEPVYFLELWHGRTAAFKDMALSILPYLLKTAVKKTGEDKKIVILTATSGDTGKAALAGFADVPGTEIFVYYPKDGVSAVQERQMATQGGQNVHVFGIKGNFDDAQTAVKNVFNDTEFGAELAARGVRLTSANSINIGRLLPQIAYYVWAYVKLAAQGALREGEKMNVCVPTGNFGNILAAYYAKRIGVPIVALLCASNENNVLTDFIKTGVYDANRKFVLTDSPSMDILVSSNLERLLWHFAADAAEESGITGDTAAREASASVREMMVALDKTGTYDAGEAVRQGLINNSFFGEFADMTAAHAAMGAAWKNSHYLIDTHTAVGYAALLAYEQKKGDKTPAVLASTASPYKFAGSVAETIGAPGSADEFEVVRKLSEYTGSPIPAGLRDLDKKPILHSTVLEKNGIKDSISRAL